MIDASLNEVEGLAAKAARGAGLAWGLAEETAKAARWLAACGLDWAPSLVRLLERSAALVGPAPATAAPVALRASNEGTELSPLLAGAYLDDLGALAGDRTLERVAHPLWLLPFAARAASATSTAIKLEWTGIMVTVWPFTVDLDGDPAQLYVPRAERVSWEQLTPAGIAKAATRRLARVDRSAVDDAAWHDLIRLGARTYVPASALSRARGAGAGLTDND